KVLRLGARCLGSRVGRGTPCAPPISKNDDPANRAAGRGLPALPACSALSSHARQLARSIQSGSLGQVNNLLEQVEQEIRNRKLFRAGQQILVAVSGGVDSMVLLRVLHELSKSNKWRLTVAHLNHQLRGRSSDGDEQLVRRTAGRLGL